MKWNFSWTNREKKLKKSWMKWIPRKTNHFYIQPSDIYMEWKATNNNGNGDIYQRSIVFRIHFDFIPSFIYAVLSHVCTPSHLASYQSHRRQHPLLLYSAIRSNNNKSTHCWYNTLQTATLPYHPMNHSNANKIKLLSIFLLFSIYLLFYNKI